MVAVGFNPRFLMAQVGFVAERRLDVASIRSSLRDEIVETILDRGLKPTATFNGRSATKTETLARFCSIDSYCPKQALISVSA